MRYICFNCENDVIKKDDYYYCEKCNKNIPEDKIIKVINLNKEAKNGIFKCPKCGSSDITFAEKEHLLKCNYCRSLYKDENQKVDDENKIKILIGTTKGEATNNIDNSNDIITLKCDGCGAEVVINTKDTPSAKCQWCHATLSLNKVLPNGITPDRILPFKITKESALLSMEKFLNENGNYANKIFKEKLTLDNIYGVYLPYMTIDANIHAKLKGKGIHLVKIKGKKKVKEEIYEVEREFDLYVDDLLVETNSNNNLSNEERANNIINSVLPFDTNNAVKYNANYLRGYSLEKRDLNYKELEDDINNKLKDISKTLSKKDKLFYNKGINWKEEDIKIIGTKWLTIYVPVWIYSYQEIRKKEKYLHYIAVNGRTNKTMGSIAPDDNKIRITTIILGFFIFPPVIYIVFYLLFYIGLYSLLVGLILYILMFKICLAYEKSMRKKLKNKNAKFNYGKNTNKSLTNIITKDKKIK